MDGARRWNKDVVASHFSLYSWPIIHPLAKKPRDVVVVSHFHGPWADESMIEGASQFAVAGKRMLEKWVYRSSDRVIAASEAFRSIVIETYGVRPDRVVAVPLAIDAHSFAVTSSLPRDLARRRIGWPENRRIVLCLRRLTQRMGLDRLVEAWIAVVAAHPDALLVIGGTGPLRDLLERQVQAVGLEQHVMFAGFVPEKDLPFAYRAADFSVVPSVAMEGFGLVILESLAAGTPVLLTPVGGMPEIMRPLEPGLVLEGSEIRHLERGLVDLLAGRLPTPLERDCVEYVQRNYNWELAARRVLDEYQVACALSSTEQLMKAKRIP
jgi:glycosyltransferase involved in cell wall biosynthesis